MLDLRDQEQDKLVKERFQHYGLAEIKPVENGWPFRRISICNSAVPLLPFQKRPIRAVDGRKHRRLVASTSSA
jgi:hypothetical protein